MALTDYLETALLQHVFTGVAYTPPATVYLALYTTSPTDIGTDGTEVSGGSYARQPVTWALGAGGAGRVQNNASIGFAGMPEGTIVACALFDAVTAGNMLAYADAGPFTVVAGENVNVAVAALNFYLG